MFDLKAFFALEYYSSDSEAKKAEKLCGIKSQFHKENFYSIYPLSDKQHGLLSAHQISSIQAHNALICNMIIFSFDWKQIQTEWVEH